MQKVVEVPIFTCNRCGHQFLARGIFSMKEDKFILGEPFKRCPAVICKTPLWNTERTRNIKNKARRIDE